MYFYYEINFYCGKLGYEFIVMIIGIYGFEFFCMLDRDCFNDEMEFKRFVIFSIYYIDSFKMRKGLYLLKYDL